VQLVDAYEEDRHAVETSRLSALDSLKHLLQENGMDASDLARLPDVHPSMGSELQCQAVPDLPVVSGTNAMT
jgi:HTH-type transcriptional regulator / antitoxin HigA